MSETRFTCPCCGYRTLFEPSGSNDICKVCFWEDDGVQPLDPAYPGGANEPSLMKCQENFRRIGACEERFLSPQEYKPVETWYYSAPPLMLHVTLTRL